MQNIYRFKRTLLVLAMAGLSTASVLLTSGCALLQGSSGASVNAASNQVKQSYDFAFTLKGDALAMPVQVFTDGKNTYVQIKPNHSVADDGITMPADAAGQILALRFKRQNAYLVLSGKQSRFNVNTSDGKQAQIAYAGDLVVAVPQVQQPTPAKQVPVPEPVVAPTPKPTVVAAVIAPVVPVAVAPVAAVKPVTAPVPVVLPAVLPVVAPAPVALQVATPVSIAASLSEGETRVAPKPMQPVKPPENLGLSLYAVGAYEKTALQVLNRWATVAGYRLVLNDVLVTSKFPNHSVEYVDLPLLPEHFKLPVSNNLDAAVSGLAKPFGGVDMSSVQFMVNPQTNIKTIVVSSRSVQVKPAVAVPVATTAKPASAQTPSVAPFAMNTSDASLIGVLARWAQQSGYQTKLNGAAVDMTTFPVHSTAFTDFGLTQAAKALKPAGSFVAGLQGIMGAFANQDLSQFKMQLLSDQRVLQITSTDPTKIVAMPMSK
jgi:hypothetical protein